MFEEKKDRDAAGEDELMKKQLRLYTNLVRRICHFAFV